MPTELGFRVAGGTSSETVTDLNPLPVKAFGPLQAGGLYRTVRVAIDVSTGAYTANDAVGSLFQIPGAARMAGGGGFIQMASLLDLTAQNAALDLFFFDRPVTGTADNAAYGLSDADARAALIGHISFSNYATVASSSVATQTNLGFFFTSPDGNLWAQFVTRGTPTYALHELFLTLQIAE